MLVLNTTNQQQIETSNSDFGMYPDFSQFLFFMNTVGTTSRTSSSSMAPDYTFFGDGDETNELVNFTYKNVGFAGVNKPINKVKSVSEDYGSRRGFKICGKVAQTTYTGDSNMNFTVKYLGLSGISGTVGKKIKGYINTNALRLNFGTGSANARTNYEATLSIFLKIGKIDNSGVITYGTENKIVETPLTYQYLGNSGTAPLSIGNTKFSYSLETDGLSITEGDNLICWFRTNLTGTKTQENSNTITTGFGLEITFGKDGSASGVDHFITDANCSPLPVQISIE